MDGNEKGGEKGTVCFKLDDLSPAIYNRTTKLDLSGQNLCQVPESVANLQNLKSLILSNNKITHIPHFIQKLLHLEELIARDNKLQNISTTPTLKSLHDETLVKVDTAYEDSIYTEDELNIASTTSPPQHQQSISEFDWSSLPTLSTIDLSDNQFHEFPISLCKARNIVKLNLSGNPIRCLPLMFKSYNVIRHLTLERIEFTHLFELPYWLFNLKRCTVLSFAHSCVGSLMESFPSDVGYVCRLITKLDLRGAGLRDFPECVVSMLDLEYLWLSNPVTKPKLNPLSEINMNVNMVWQIPCQLASLTALTHFEVCNVRLSIIPSSFCALINLQHFNACCNTIESLPKSFFDLVNLTYLNLSDNDLVFLPNGLKKLVKLNVLYLGYNKIYDVRELEHLHGLQELDLYSNRLSEVDLPKNLLKLDLANNKICQQYLTDKFGLEYLAKYQNLQDSLRKSLDANEMRVELEEKIEELDFGSEYISYHEDKDDYEDDSLDIFADELHPDLNNKAADTKPGVGSYKDDLAEQTDDEEDWNEFIPVRKSSHTVKSKLYKSYPDAELENAVFCPAESHPLSLVKTTSTARAKSINQRHTEIRDPNGIFEDAD